MWKLPSRTTDTVSFYKKEEEKENSERKRKENESKCEIRESGVDLIFSLWLKLERIKYTEREGKIEGMGAEEIGSHST